jgi:hypothetical protein
MTAPEPGRPCPAQRAWQRLRTAPRRRALGALLALALFAAAAAGGGRVLGRAARRARCAADPEGADADGYGESAEPRPAPPRAAAAALARAPDACAAALELPQVALLFLTRGAMPHEAAWREWFRAAAGRAPAAALAAAACAGGPRWEAARAACAGGADLTDPAADPLDAIARQSLFDVWVHPPPTFPGFPPGSLFAGRELPPALRTATHWGTHSLVDAARALLAAALTNPRAQKFVLLSESDLPLYHPAALHAQLAGEPRSRVNACNASAWARDEYRFRPDMAAAGLAWPTWRKSWQWWALARRHAAAVVDDAVVDAAFRATCRPRWDAGAWCARRVCYSDEHYVPTVRLRGLPA